MGDRIIRFSMEFLEEKQLILRVFDASCPI